MASTISRSESTRSTRWRKTSLSAATADATSEALIDKLKQGGYIVYFRHAQTEKDYADQLTADVNDGSTQRVLSEEGWHDAVKIGEAFRALEIPVGDAISSEYFRAWQTAWLAFGTYKKDPQLKFLPFEEYTDAQVEEMKERVTPLLIKKPAQGTNTIIVAHDDPFEAVTGIYPKPQGVGFVMEPTGTSFSVVGSIAPDAWPVD